MAKWYYHKGRRVKRSYLNPQKMDISNRKEPNAEFMKTIRQHQREVSDSADVPVPTTQLRLSDWLGAVQAHGSLTRDVPELKQGQPVIDSRGQIVTEKQDIAPPLVAKIFRENLKKLWQSDFRQKMNTFNCIVLQCGKHTETRMYFCGLEFILLRRHFFVLERSIVYNSRDTALKAYNNNRVLWVKDDIRLIEPPS